MGKGKGALTRYSSRVKQNHNLFEFVGFNLKDLFKLKKIFLKKTNIPLKIYSNFFLNKYSKHYNKVENIFFFKRYKK